jgi:hypothetical protein
MRNLEKVNRGEPRRVCGPLQSRDRQGADAQVSHLMRYLEKVNRGEPWQDYRKEDLS